MYADLHIMPHTIPVATTSEIPPGEGIVVEHGELSIAVFNVEGSYLAIDNTCCHRGGPLGEGDLEGSVVTCPWHGWQYDVVSGECLSSPGEFATRYAVEVVEDQIRVLL